MKKSFRAVDGQVFAMEMQQIRYFLALARTLNFTRAAEECHVTQPALTRAIQALEAELGGPLLRRERQHSHLTELGRRMVPLMQRCYDSALAAKDLAQAVRKSDLAPLSIALSQTVNPELFMRPIAELFRAFRGFQLRLLQGDSSRILQSLKDGDADVAIAGPLADEWERLDHWPLFEENFDLALHQDLPIAGQNGASIAALEGVAIFLQSGCESANDLRAALQPLGRTDDATHQISSLHGVVALIEAQLGVALVPRSAPLSEKVRRMRLIDVDVRRVVSLYAVAGRQRSAAATAFLNLARAASYPRET